MYTTRLQDETRKDVAFDVNVRMVLLAHELGLGYAALKKISKVLGIPALHLKTYQRHDKRVTGSSKAMEQESAKRMWARSVNRHQVRYTEMLSDGDSAAFREVVALNPYPGHEVVKLECINHAHKRMGTAFRKLSSQGKLGGKGVGKLTAKKCKTLQNYYRGAILNNQGSIDQMKAEIWAGLLHGMSTDDSPLHTRCNPSWCWYRKAEDNGETPGSHKLHSANFLKREVGQKLIP
ncbi:hypothetical protein F7725_017511, partial [Dissostichus mawsoni]